METRVDALDPNLALSCQGPSCQGVSCDLASDTPVAPSSSTFGEGETPGTEASASFWDPLSEEPRNPPTPNHLISILEAPDLHSARDFTTARNGSPVIVSHILDQLNTSLK